MVDLSLLRKCFETATNDYSRNIDYSSVEYIGYDEGSHVLIFTFNYKNEKHVLFARPRNNGNDIYCITKLMHPINLAIKIDNVVIPLFCPHVKGIKIYGDQ